MHTYTVTDPGLRRSNRSTVVIEGEPGAGRGLQLESGVSVYDIIVRSSGDGSITVELRGEFDLSSAAELRSTLDHVAGFRKPMIVDLSGVTFMDLQSTRELAVRFQLYAHHLSLVNPSWQARASVKACKLEEWVPFGHKTKQPLEKVS